MIIKELIQNEYVKNTILLGSIFVNIFSSHSTSVQKTKLMKIAIYKKLGLLWNT